MYTFISRKENKRSVVLLLISDHHKCVSVQCSWCCVIINHKEHLIIRWTVWNLFIDWYFFFLQTAKGNPISIPFKCFIICVSYSEPRNLATAITATITSATATGLDRERAAVNLRRVQNKRKNHRRPMVSILLHLSRM